MTQTTFTEASYSNGSSKTHLQDQHLDLIQAARLYDVSHLVSKLAKKHFDLKPDSDFTFTASTKKFELVANGETHSLVKDDHGNWTKDHLDIKEQAEITQTVIDIILRIKAAAHHNFPSSSSSSSPSSTPTGTSGNTVIVNCGCNHGKHGNSTSTDASSHTSSSSSSGNSQKSLHKITKELEDHLHTLQKLDQSSSNYNKDADDDDRSSMFSFSTSPFNSYRNSSSSSSGATIEVEENEEDQTNQGQAKKFTIQDITENIDFVNQQLAQVFQINSSSSSSSSSATASPSVAISLSDSSAHQRIRANYDLLFSDIDWDNNTTVTPPSKSHTAKNFKTPNSLTSRRHQNISLSISQGKLSIPELNKSDVLIKNKLDQIGKDPYVTAFVDLHHFVSTETYYQTGYWTNNCKSNDLLQSINLSFNSITPALLRCSADSSEGNLTSLLAAIGGKQDHMSFIARLLAANRILKNMTSPEVANVKEKLSALEANIREVLSKINLN